jgi:hypothetical protein
MMFLKMFRENVIITKYSVKMIFCRRKKVAAARVGGFGNNIFHLHRQCPSSANEPKCPRAGENKKCQRNFMFSRLLEINFSTDCKPEFLDFRIKIREIAQITPAARISGTQKYGFCFLIYLFICRYLTGDFKTTHWKSLEENTIIYKNV